MTSFAPGWTNYLKWNAAIAEVVYGYHAAGSAAFLDPEEEVLVRAATLAGESIADSREALLASVRQTLNSPTHPAGMFGAHVSQLRRWRASGGEPPPVIALLAVLCIAAEAMREADGLAANNYYDRLMPLFGVANESDKKRVVRSYRQHSFDLWESLNGWLEGLQGERGLPTAYAYAHAHIGLPLSQALIRATDREKLHEFFEELGLEARARLAPHDMEPMLSEWISRTPSPASHQIQALWRRSGARERITDIACQLLETWEAPAGLGRSSQSPGRTPARGSSLLLTALIRTFPTTALELNLAGPQLGGESRASPLDAMTDNQLGVDFDLTDLPDGRWRLSRPEDVEERSMLEGMIRLKHSTGVVLERRPRRLVPLKKDPLLQVFVEVERLGLGEDGLVICQTGLASVVRDALGKISRPGFRLFDPSPPGCPVGWTVISRVQVLGSLSDTTPTLGDKWPLDLNALQPIATSQLVLEGGLQLPGRVRRWSTLAPPEIRVASEDATAILVRVERVGTFQRSMVVLEQRSNEPVAVVNLEGAGLDDGDYEVIASSIQPGLEMPRRVNVTRLRLRSADAPNLAFSSEPPLGSSIHNAVGALYADDWDGTATVVRGATTSRPVVDRRDLLRTNIEAPAWWTGRRDKSEPTSIDRPYKPVRQVVLPLANPADCFRTGAHVLQLPPFYGTTTKSTVDGVCKHCGLVKRFPARYRLKGASVQRRANVRSLPTIDVSAVTAISETTFVNPDVAIDALSHDRSGRSSWIEQVALQVEPSQLFVDRFIRALERLGHVEICRDIRTMVPLSWEVLQSTFVGTRSEGFFLAGHRSTRLIDAVERAANSEGLDFESDPPGLTGPRRLRVLTHSAGAMTLLSEAVKELTGDIVTITPDGAHAIAALLPPLSTVLSALPRQAMVAATDVRRWDMDLARWRSVGDAHIPGSYQIHGPTTIYCLRDTADIAAGTMRRVDARLAKHAAALLAGQQLIGYDATGQTLYVPLGADLPGLYDRVAVLCSGLLPVEDQTQRVLLYPAVPLDVAEHLIAILR